VLATMNLKELGVPYIVCKASDETHRQVLLKLGADKVVIPEQEQADRLAKSLSGAADYFPRAKAAIREMVRQVGPCRFDGDGLLKKGVIIRHLLLPGQLAGAKEVMDWVSREFEPGTVLLSLMSQYTPWGRAKAFPEIDRKLRKGEIRAAQQYMDALGLQGFMQDSESAKREYTPEFDLTGI